jgi:REP element-mobilizing transposase RayT
MRIEDHIVEPLSIDRGRKLAGPCQTRVLYLCRIKMGDKQLAIQFPATWGGRRAGAGRKRLAPRKRVPHSPRPKLASRFPVHVTVRLLDGLPRLRGFELGKLLRRAFVRSCDKPGFRICQFSIQGNHIHLICEARTSADLARGVQGWKIRVTRSLNHRWHRRGTVFDDRYHTEIMKSPRQVRNSICYVMQNGRRHGRPMPAWAGGIDPFSSAWYFHGWQHDRWRRGLAPPPEDPDAPGDPVAEAHTWLLRIAWRRHGLIAIDEVPAAGRPRASRPARRA